MKTITAMNRQWPDTGRAIKRGDRLAIVRTHLPWDDLLKADEKRRVWIYISTLPHQETAASNIGMAD